MQRYSSFAINSMHESTDGEYVKYSDVEALIARNNILEK